MKLNLTRRMFIGGLLSSGLAGCQSAGPAKQFENVRPKFDWGFIRFSEVRAFRLNWDKKGATEPFKSSDGKLNSTLLPTEGIKLNDQQVKTLKRATTREYGKAPLPMRFSPHHAFAFYDQGRMVGYLEICFLYNEHHQVPDGFSSSWDMTEIRGLLIDLGIPLANYDW